LIGTLRPSGRASVAVSRDWNWIATVPAFASTTVGVRAGPVSYCPPAIDCQVPLTALATGVAPWARYQTGLPTPSYM